MESLEVTLSAREIYFLSELLKIECIVGMKDPHEGLAEKELKDEWNQTKEELLKKQILFEGDTYEIDRKHAILIHALRPQSVCLWVNQIKDNEQKSAFYYFTSKLVVKKTSAINNCYRLELVGTPKEAVDEIIKSFSLSSNYIIANESTTLLKNTFDYLLKLRRNPDLEEYVRTNNTVAKLIGFVQCIQTFKMAGQIGMVVWDDKQNKWENDEISFIKGENGIWFTTPEMVDGMEKVLIQSRTPLELEDQIINRLKKFLSLEVANN
jgi:hypothetical protein